VAATGWRRREGQRERRAGVGTMRCLADSAGFGLGAPALISTETEVFGLLGKPAGRKTALFSVLGATGDALSVDEKVAASA
jgi:hypothetical protein